MVTPFGRGRGHRHLSPVVATARMCERQISRGGRGREEDRCDRWACARRPGVRKLATGTTDSPKAASANESKKHVAGKPGTPFGHCVLGSAQLLKDKQS